MALRRRQNGIPKKKSCFENKFKVFVKKKKKKTSNNWTETPQTRLSDASQLVELNGHKQAQC